MMTLALLLALLTSCKTSAPHYNYRELARASVRLGMDIDLKDNHKLYVESSKWISTGMPGGYGTSMLAAILPLKSSSRICSVL